MSRYIRLISMMTVVLMTLTGCRMHCEPGEPLTTTTTTETTTETTTKTTTTEPTTTEPTTTETTTEPTTTETRALFARILGTFRLTFYVPDAQWGYQTSTGAKSEHLRTCAVDPTVIPYGSVIQITGSNGQTLTLRAVDCGSAVKGNHIDIFWDGSKDSGREWIEDFGTRHEVKLLRGGDKI